MTALIVRVLERERLVVLSCLLAVTGLAWLYLVADVARMGEMAGMSSAPAPDMTVTAPGGMASGEMSAASAAGPFVMTFLMWSVMMVGMMLPSAAPAILLFLGIARNRRERAGPVPSALAFAAGYIALWVAFSALAAVLQTWLEQLRLLTPMLRSASAAMTGFLLIGAGVYQWLPVKEACLRQCRAPLQTFLFHWRSGAMGAFRMGAQHGLYCLGCCWALMLLLFTAGVMNLLWVAMIAALVFVEKLLPMGHAFARGSGFLMVVAGLYWLVAAA
ncbi:DUF2182 domain-containing protein [Rhodobacteraceae bacterium DSL-40]|uniref:DUF2182 domain-containing protein n=1 Tax=Amaricoccus sp. B4 TaxID=3368557 RepID=UPI000DAC9914